MIALDLPPKLFVPKAPAIIRPIGPRLLTPGYLPTNRAARRVVVKELVRSGVIERGQAEAIFGPPPFWKAGADISFLGLLTAEGHDANVLAALDAGDINSTDGSSQTWTDPSLNGGDFYRGTDGTSEGSDPTHNGTPGGLSESEYWSFDGGDYFTEAADDWGDHPMSKNSAAYTWVFVCEIADLSNYWFFFGNVGGSGAAELGLYFDTTITTGTMDLVVRRNNSPAGNAIVASSTANITAAQMQFIAISVDEASGAGHFYVDGAEETFTSTYSSPNASSSVTPMTLCFSQQLSSSFWPSGSKLWGTCILDKGLSVAEMDSLYASFSANRFPSLP